mmetsp:Transcript_12627/g.29720  ORF Transcript_12627/g.29720 Transcript_12627/m.29720 type:complete len:223 (-) Transcript_12627:617-1285(-)
MRDGRTFVKLPVVSVIADTGFRLSLRTLHHTGNRPYFLQNLSEFGQPSTRATHGANANRGSILKGSKALEGTRQFFVPLAGFTFRKQDLVDLLVNLQVILPLLLQANNRRITLYAAHHNVAFLAHHGDRLRCRDSLVSNVICQAHGRRARDAAFAVHVDTLSRISCLESRNHLAAFHDALVGWCASILSWQPHLFHSIPALLARRPGILPAHVYYEADVVWL